MHLYATDCPKLWSLTSYSVCSRKCQQKQVEKNRQKKSDRPNWTVLMMLLDRYFVLDGGDRRINLILLAQGGGLGGGFEPSVHH